ncbi:MAG TPA: ABC transporter permease, partial [Phenylobacterium sp.]
MPLSLKTLLYEWRRFAPAMVAVAFSGLLVLLQAAIILGIFSLSSQYVTRSTADLWIGYPGVQSLDLGRPIGGQAELFAWTNPHVRRIEPFLWGSGEWRTRSRGMVNVYIVGVQPDADAMALSGALSPSERAALAQPDAVLVDAADLHKLQVAVGGSAEINGRLVRVVGLTHGLRALGGVNVIASLPTTRRLDPASGPRGRVAYLLAQLDSPASTAEVAKSLNAIGARRGFEALSGPDFARRTTLYWLVESGAGVAFL